MIAISAAHSIFSTMKSQLLRVHTPAEIQAVADLAGPIWREHYTPIVGEAQVEYMLRAFQSAEAITRQIAAEGYEYYLLPDSAYLALQPLPAENALFLSKIYVKSSLRGTGIGRRLIEFAETRTHELGLGSFFLTVNKHNTASIAFYERMGMHIEKAIQTDIGHGFIMDDYLFRKPLPLT